MKHTLATHAVRLAASVIIAALFVTPSAAVSFSAEGGRDIQTPVPTEAFITGWMVLGAFPISPLVEGEPVPADWRKDFINLQSLDSLSGTTAGRQWKPIFSDEPVINLVDQFDRKENAAAYVAKWVWSDSDRRVNLLVGSDDGVAVYVNGEKFFEKHEARPTVPDEDVVPVQLRRGTNMLVLRITQGVSGWDFAARFDDNQGLAFAPGGEPSSWRPMLTADDLGGRGKVLPQFFIQPYVQNVSTDTATLMWQTSVPSQGLVRVTGPDGTQEFKTPEARKLHEIRISGLQPGSRYLYYVEALGRNGRLGDWTTGTGWSFRTFPEGEGPLRFVVFGDSRSHPERLKQVLDAMADERNVHFALHSGDLVGNGNDYFQWKPEYFDPIAQTGKSLPIFTVLGNHEGNSPYYFDYFSLPGDERYYSFDVRGIHIIGLDSNVPFDEESEQYAWLVEDLEQNRDARRTFIVLHHPPFTSGPHGAMENGVPRELGIRTGQRIIPELARKYSIDAVFAGHDHLYERSQVDGVYYITAGGGGAPSYAPSQSDNNPHSQKIVRGLSYTVVDIDDSGNVDIYTRNEQGEEVDRVSLD